MARVSKLPKRLQPMREFGGIPARVVEPAGEAREANAIRARIQYCQPAEIRHFR